MRFAVPPGCVVVGVDGSDDSERAVTWAAKQALLERRGLAIVHSTDHSPLRDIPWMERRSMNHHELTAAVRGLSRARLDRVHERVTVEAPGVEAITALVDLDPRLVLEQLSCEAHLLVLGSRGRGPVESAMLGSVSAYAARNAHCPVVVCRPLKTSAPNSPRVVVGADGRPASLPVLEFAFDQASLRGVPLTVMHSFWDVLVATHGPGGIPTTERADLADLRVRLAESVAGLSEKYPDVPVTQDLARGLVDQCLADRTPDAELLVVGRADVRGWSRFLHVSCAMAVLERAHTTVAVVPETYRGDEGR